MQVMAFLGIFLVVADGCGWLWKVFWVVVDGFWWFWVVADGGCLWVVAYFRVTSSQKFHNIYRKTLVPESLF